MTAGVKNLRRIQLGKESVVNTSVPTTTRYRGFGMLKDNLVVKQIDEDVGVLGDTDRSLITYLEGQLDLPEDSASFEQLPYLFAMGMGGPTTGAADGAGTDKIYTTNVPTTAKPTTTSYTVQGGDDFEVEQMEGAVCTRINLKGEMGGDVRVSANLLGRQVQRLAGGFTAIAIPTLEDAIALKGKVYLDAIGGTYGTTQLTQQIIAFDVTYQMLWVPQPTMDGNLYYSYVNYVGQIVTGKLTFEHDTGVSGNAGAKADWRAQTAKKLRLDITGNAVQTGGTTYQAKHMILDFPMKWRMIDKVGEKNGNDIVDGEFFSRYNLTAGDAGKAIFVNELTSLT